jgi:hypothetical protein
MPNGAVGMAPGVTSARSVSVVQGRSGPGGPGVPGGPGGFGGNAAASMAMPFMRSGVAQQPQQTGIPPTPGQQPLPPQTPQLSQLSASPQRDARTNILFEFSGLSPNEQEMILSVAGLPNNRELSSLTEPDKVCRNYFVNSYHDSF